MRIIRRSLAFAGLALAVGLGCEPAGAIVCAAGVHHAGCAGPRGAAVARRPYGAAAVARPYGAAVVRPVPRPGVACVWRAGVRVCR
jgi:hypothetical protein